MKERVPEPSMPDPDVWVDQYGDYLHRFALSRVKDPSVAEELVQETFLAALRSQENFQGRSSPRTWLIAILKHKIIDYYRKKRHEEPRDDLESFTDSPDHFFNEKGSWEIRPNKWSTNPTKVYEQREFMEVFYRCVSELPERLARTFMLREMDGLSTEEICKILNITATNCWVILYRARMNLRQCLELRWLKLT
jgi:RNA polymerase sigma-70 factor (ECF subfamily)